MRQRIATFLRRRWLLMALILALLIFAIGYALLAISNARCFSLTGEAVCRVETDAPLVALSLDDGPTPEGVDAALAALRPTGSHATFFVIGNQVEGHEEFVRRMLADGHEVGNHSWTHPRMIGLSSDELEDEIMRTDALLRRAGVTAPTLFRPPFGKKLWALPAALERHGYRMIMWDVEDPAAETPQAYADRVVAEARPGSIILMHVMDRPNSMARAALPLVVRGLTRRGFRVVSVGELLQQRR